MRGFIFLFLEVGRKMSRIGFAFVTLLAAVFLFIIGRFLAIRFDWIDANSVVESAVEWASWMDFGAEILVVLPFVLLAGLIIWGRYGSRMTLYDLSASQQKMFHKQWSGTGAFSMKWLMGRMTTLGWITIPVFGITILYYASRLVFGF